MKYSIYVPILGVLLILFSQVNAFPNSHVKKTCSIEEWYKYMMMNFSAKEIRDICNGKKEINSSGGVTLGGESTGGTNEHGVQNISNNGIMIPESSGSGISQNRNQAILHSNSRIESLLGSTSASHFSRMGFAPEEILNSPVINNQLNATEIGNEIIIPPSLYYRQWYAPVGPQK